MSDFEEVKIGEQTGIAKVYQTAVVWNSFHIRCVEGTGSLIAHALSAAYSEGRKSMQRDVAKLLRLERSP